MSCPTCGLRQWKYNAYTLTCKNGHQIPVGKKYWRPDPKKLIPATAAATVALDLLIRTAT